MASGVTIEAARTRRGALGGRGGALLMGLWMGLSMVMAMAPQATAQFAADDTRLAADDARLTTVTAEVSSPREVVEGLQTTLLEAMRGGAELGYDGRLALIEPVASSAHSASSLARLVLHSNWEGLDEAQQARFVDTLRRLTAAAYAARFDRYNGQRFEIVQEREVREGVTLVRTRLHKANGEAVALDYLLRRFEAGWRIVNIIADGVSEVSVKRAEYDAVIARDGFDALLATMERQIADYQASGRDADL